MELPRSTLSFIRYLNDNKIKPILYGSQGVSLYLGNFKKFSDVDFLVSPHLLEEDWEILQTIMNKSDYSLVDLHEHEFSNEHGESVAFANENILISDGIISSLSDIQTVKVNGTDVRTLSAADFKKAYEYSIEDGYRKDVRGKNDEYIITLLERYLQGL